MKLQTLFNPHNVLIILLSIFIHLITAQCLGQPAPSNYTEQQTIQLIRDIQQIGYSPDQRLLIVLQKDNQNSFFVFNGRTYDNKRQIQITDSQKPTVTPVDFQFSKDNTLLIIQSKQGGIYGFKIKNGQIILPYKYKLRNYLNLTFFSISPFTNLIATQGNCILYKNLCTTYFLQIPKVQHQQSTYLDIYKIILTPPELSIQFFSIQWSQIYPSKVLITYTYEDEVNKQLYQTAIYDLQPEPKKQKIVLFQNSDQAMFLWNDSLILTSYYNLDEPIYIFKYNQTNDNYTSQLQIDEVQNVFTQIKIFNSNYFATGSDNGFTIFWKIFYIFPNASNNSSLDYKIIFKVQAKRFALSKSGNQALVVTNYQSNKATRYTLCALGQYLLGTNCYNCTNFCKTCISQTICLSCLENKFIYGDLCVDCDYILSGCLNCSNLSFCLSCNSQNNWKLEPLNGRCICKDGYGLNDTQCVSCDNMLLGCLKCSNLSFCLSCNSQNNWKLEPQNGRCICKDGYALNGTQCQEKPIVQDDNFLYYAIGGGVGVLILIVGSIITIKKCKSRKRQSKLSSLLVLQGSQNIENSIRNKKTTSRKNVIIEENTESLLSQNQRIKSITSEQIQQIVQDKRMNQMKKQSLKSLQEKNNPFNTDINSDNILTESKQPLYLNNKKSSNSKIKFQSSVVNVTTKFNINNVKNPYQIKILQEEQSQSPSLEKYEQYRQRKNLKNQKHKFQQNQNESTGFRQQIIDDAYIQERFPQNQEQ